MPYFCLYKKKMIGPIDKPTTNQEEFIKAFINDHLTDIPDYGDLGPKYHLVENELVVIYKD